MKTKKYIMLLSALLLTIPISSNAAVTFEIDSRDNNNGSAGNSLQSNLEDGIHRFNRMDCEANISIRVTVSTDLAVGSRKVYFYEGDCIVDGTFKHSNPGCTLLEHESGTTFETFKLQDLVNHDCATSNTINLYPVYAEEEFSNPDDGYFNVDDETLSYYSEGSGDAPTGIETSIGASSVTLKWNAMDSKDIKGYAVVYWSGTGMDNGSGDADTDSDADSDTDTDADGGIIDESDTNGNEDSDLNDGGIYTNGVRQEDDTDATNEISCPSGGPVKGEPFDYALISNFATVDSNETNSKTIENLDQGTLYKFAVVSLGANHNPSVFSKVVCAAPQETVDFFDDYCKNGGEGCDGGYCFIATSAFGNYNHPMVLVLRHFRDNFLLKMPFGNAVVNSYYTVGPHLASVVEGHDTVRSVVVNLLMLFAGFAMLLLWIGPVNVGLGLGGGALIGVVLGLLFPVARRRV